MEPDDYYEEPDDYHEAPDEEDEHESLERHGWEQV